MTAEVPDSAIVPQEAAELYERMLLIRRFEERISDLYMQGRITGPLHVSIGQEAVAVGVCSNLRDADYVTSTHRGHGHCIAKGADPKKMMAELLGRATGYCKGKGGSLHLADLTIGLLGTSGIVGGGIPIAVGAALTASLHGRQEVAVAFFGDGGAQEGIFHEALNLAAVWRLPIVFVCENNLYAVTVPLSRQSSVEDIAVRAAGYNMPGVTVDGMDVLAVREAATEAIGHARRGEGPALLECKTYRFAGHSRGDPGVGVYRSEQEVAEWRKRDPLDVLQRNAALGVTVIGELEARVERQIEEAQSFAVSSPLPDIEEAFIDVFGDRSLLR